MKLTGESVTKLLDEINDAMVMYKSFRYRVEYSDETKIKMIFEFIDSLEELVKGTGFQFSKETELVESLTGDESKRGIVLRLYFQKYNEDGSKVEEFAKGDYVCFESPAPNKEIYKVALKPKKKHGMTYFTIEDSEGKRREFISMSFRVATSEEVKAKQRLD